MRLARAILAALLGIPLLAVAAVAGPLDDALQDTLRKAYALPDAELTIVTQLDAPIGDDMQAFATGARFANLLFDRTSGRFSVVVLLPGGAPAAQLALSGQVTATAEVPVLRDMVARGQLIGQDLVDYSLVPGNRLTSDLVLDAADLVGKAARRTLHPGRPLRTADLMAPIVVPKNKLVTMIYATGSMHLTARGRSLGDGGAGDMVKVLNIDSKRTVDAIIVDNDTVNVVGNVQQ
jgi:flagella basal body P-ring formation protein FlgA